MQKFILLQLDLSLSSIIYHIIFLAMNRFFVLLHSADSVPGSKHAIKLGFSPNNVR